LGLADDLQCILIEFLRPRDERDTFIGGEDELEVRGGFSRMDRDFLPLTGFFPLLLAFFEIECLTMARIASSWISGSWSHAVPATLNFRNFIQLLVNVPVLSENM
jgi:hypothetical protein